MAIGGGLSIRLYGYLFRDSRVYPFAFAVIVGGLVGARIAHIADNWSQFDGDIVRMVTFQGGGIATMGAPLGSSIGKGASVAERWAQPAPASKVTRSKGKSNFADMGELPCQKQTNTLRLSSRNFRNAGAVPTRRFYVRRGSPSLARWRCMQTAVAGQSSVNSRVAAIGAGTRSRPIRIKPRRSKNSDAVVVRR